MLRRLILSFVTVIGLAAAGKDLLAAPAFVLDGTTENTVFFNDRGVVLRQTPAGSTSTNYGGLTGWDLVPVGAPDGSGGFILPLVGDVEFEIFQSQNIEAPNGNEIWIQTGTDRFQGFAAFEVTAISGTVATGLEVDFGPLSVADPFGILAAGEILAMFIDDGPGAVTAWLPNAGTLAGAVASVTNGDLWATFGFPGVTQGTGGYLYQNNFDALGNPQSGTGFAALDVMQDPAGIGFLGVNDPTETLYGGAALLTSIWAQQKFSRNPVFIDGTGSELSLFQFQSDDPLVFVGTPEPASIVLFSGMFGGLLGFRRLQRKKTA